jgi:hypothetical protein
MKQLLIALTLLMTSAAPSMALEFNNNTVHGTFQR